MVWDVFFIVFFVNLFLVVVMVLNGMVVFRYYIGFFVLFRVSFGIYGYYFVVVLCLILGIIWGGV